MHKKEQNLTPFERLLEHYGDAWVWVAFSPEFKLVSAFVVGKRRQEEADHLIQQVDLAVERSNEHWRQHCHRLTRKTNGFSKELTWLEKHLHLCLAYYHFVRPHGSWRRLRPAQPTKGSGSLKKWAPCTPAMAIGLTDHVWTMQGLLSCRVVPLEVQNLG